MRSITMVFALVFTGVTGCATPDEIKQATSALDVAYDDNIALMTKYRDTVDAMNELHHSWSRYILTRHLVNKAIQCATLAEATACTEKILGGRVLGWVNQYRLSSLPAQAPLEAGKVSLSHLIQGLPALIPLVEEEAASHVLSQDLAAFDEYGKKVMVLKAANRAVKDYLDIDVTVSKDDVDALADAIEKLGKKQ